MIYNITNKEYESGEGLEVKEGSKLLSIISSKVDIDWFNSRFKFYLEDGEYFFKLILKDFISPIFNKKITTGPNGDDDFINPYWYFQDVYFFKSDFKDFINFVELIYNLEKKTDNDAVNNINSFKIKEDSKRPYLKAWILHEF